MFKLFRKKSGKKGFTLAELLIVVAIIAILVAIAMPIFMNAMREAQMRTNEANIRSVKAEGVATILTNWSQKDSSKGTDIAAGVGEDKGWFVLAKVSATGEISDLKVYTNNPSKVTNADYVYTWTGLRPTGNTNGAKQITSAADGTGAWLSDGSGNIDQNLKYISPSKGYVVQVYLTDDDLDLS